MPAVMMFADPGQPAPLGGPSLGEGRELLGQCTTAMCQRVCAMLLWTGAG